MRAVSWGRVALLTGILWLVPCKIVVAQVVSPNTLLPECSQVVVGGNEPSLAAQGSELVAVWQGGCTSNVRAAVSRDGGAVWKDASAIPWTGYAYAPSAVCSGDSGRFYATAPVFVDAVGVGIGVVEGRFVAGEIVWRPVANPILPPYGSSKNPTSIAIAFDPLSRGLFVVFTKIVNAAVVPGPEEPNGTLNHERFEYRTIFVRSTDLGQNWEPQQVMTGLESSGAKIVTGPSGELTVVWENYILGKLIGRRSYDFGASFGPEFELMSLRDNVATAPGGWDPESSPRIHPLMRFNNTGCMRAPAAYSVAVDRSTGPRRGTWYMVTTEHATGTIGPLTGSVSQMEPNDTYATANPFEIGNDVNGSISFTETGYDVDVYTFLGERGQTLWMNGLYFGNSLNPSFAPAILCGDDLASITYVNCSNMLSDGTGPSAIYTLPSTGRYYIRMVPSFGGVGYRFMLRTLTIDSMSVARDHRDILLSSSTDGGVTWSPKVRVTDGPVGSEEMYPEVAVDEEGRVHVAWYDRRDAVSCGAQTNTYWSWSADGGQTFARAVRINEETSDFGQSEDLRWGVGNHLGLATSPGKVHVVWTRATVNYKDTWSTVITDVPTAVLVSGLRAEERTGRAELRWQVGDVSEIGEFRIHRATGAGEYALAATVTPSLDREYHWRDETARAGNRYRYRLEVVRRAGGSIWEGPVDVLIALPASRLAWRGAVPNPFADAVALQIETPNRAGTRIAVYDVTGHQVAVLLAEPEGEDTVVRWNGRDARGRLVAPGVYLVRAQLGARTVVRQVVRMK